jgi:excisionase family DNA binding protein
VPEVAKLLKTNSDYVHKLRKSGLLPFLKLGQYKCRKEALDKFLAEHEGQDVTDPENVRTL